LKVVISTMKTDLIYSKSDPLFLKQLLIAIRNAFIQS